MPDVQPIPSGVVDPVVRSTARFFGVSDTDLTSATRRVAVCEARWVAAAILRDLLYSTAAIARALHRDHSTVVNGFNRLATREDLQEYVLILERRLPPRVYHQAGRAGQVPSLPDRLGQAVEGLDQLPRLCIEAYCTAILAGSYRSPTLVWWGGYYLLRWPHHRDRVLAVLRDEEQRALQQMLAQHRQAIYHRHL